MTQDSESLRVALERIATEARTRTGLLLTHTIALWG